MGCGKVINIEPKQFHPETLFCSSSRQPNLPCGYCSLGSTQRQVRERWGREREEGVIERDRERMRERERDGVERERRESEIEIEREREMG
jgi:hypothetical protein